MTGRILILATNGFGAPGGIARFNRDLVTAIAARSSCNEIVVVARRGSHDAKALPPKVMQSSGHDSLPLFAARLAQVLGRDRSFDLIVNAHINLTPFALAARAASGAQVATFLYGTDAWEPPPRLSVRYAVGRADRFVVISEITRQRFAAWSRVAQDRIALLPCTVSLDAFSPGPADARLVARYGLAGRTVLMTLGFLLHDKGVEDVLAVLPRLAERMPSLVFLICGEGPEKPRLQERARQQGVADRCIFAGFVAEQEKPSYYRLADAFILAGRYEGFGIALLEAMACGVPAIASGLDGSCEAVGNGALGTVVDPGDHDDLTRGILEVLSRPKGQPPRGLDRFAFPAFAARVGNLLDMMLGSTPHAK